MDDIEACFPGTREDAVAEGRADFAAGRVFTAEAMAVWAAALDTDQETSFPVNAPENVVKRSRPFIPRR